MFKKSFIVLIILFFITMLPFASGFQDEFEENCDNVNLSILSSEFINHTDGYYVYSANFYVNNLSSKHDIEAKVLFYNGNELVDTDCDWGYSIYSGYIFNDYTKKGLNSKNDDLAVDFGKFSENPDLNTLEIFTYIECDNLLNITHFKVYLYDKSDDKLIFQTSSSFNMSNQISVNDTKNRIDEGAYIDAMLEWDKKDFELFENLDSDSDDLIEFEEFKKISDFEKYDYLKTYTDSDLKEEYDVLDMNGDGFLTAREFKEFI